MRGAVLPRHDTRGLHLKHPEHLAFGPYAFYLVEDPATQVFASGDGLLGWEGDERLALYICPQRSTWELCRLELDGTYSSCCRITAGAYNAVEVVGMLVGWLVTHDGRRGYDPLAEIVAAEEAKEAKDDAALTEVVKEDLAPRLKHALIKDGLD